jgi:hypothetical protein
MEKLVNGMTAGESLPPIPAKRYFTIGEVGELCEVKRYSAYSLIDTIIQVFVGT